MHMAGSAGEGALSRRTPVGVHLGYPNTPNAGGEHGADEVDSMGVVAPLGAHPGEAIIPALNG